MITEWNKNIYDLFVLSYEDAARLGKETALNMLATILIIEASYGLQGQSLGTSLNRY